ncbi:hypothetical protein AGMMS49949_02930 [Alphaproteobacteria bacterium]|nr:hypothetical protein AGMMS49949_02930 [Alphaproteobacteria bacterium]GHS96139.1 hypothetical protein AGMMS50296_2000 [Alphaproteobacteria bacterium]
MPLSFGPMSFPLFLEEANIFRVPSLKEIQDFSRDAMACCPLKIQKTLKDTLISVENFAPAEVLKELRVKNKNELLGLYRINDEPSKKRELVLYRVPLVLYSKTSCEPIFNVVARVTVYEISHRTDCVALRKQWLDKIRKL